MNGINFENKEPKILTLLGEKNQIIFNKEKSNEVRDFYFPNFKIDGTTEQLEAIRLCYSENVVNVVGPVQEGSPEAFLLEKEQFHSGWHGTGANKRKYYKNALANKKIYSQNGDLVIGASLMINVNIGGKRGTIMVNDPSRGPAGIGMATGNSEFKTNPNDSFKETISQLLEISLATACREGYEEIGINIDPNLLKHSFTYVNNPMFKEIVGELDNHLHTSNAPSNIVVVWQADFVNKKAIEMLNSIGITEAEFNEAFDGDGTIIFKEHDSTHSDKGPEFAEISHHMFIPEIKLTGVTCKIEKLQKDGRFHPLALIQTAFGIPRQADWSNVPLILNAKGTILHEKMIPNDTCKAEGAWLKNLKEIKELLASAQ